MSWAPCTNLAARRRARGGILVLAGRRVPLAEDDDTLTAEDPGRELVAEDCAPPLVAEDCVEEVTV